MNNNSLPSINVFVDECGTNELDVSKPSVSHLFICVAIMVEDDDLIAGTDKIKEIQKAFFSGNEIKSSKVGSKIDRRLRILKAIAELPFRYYALIINKSKLQDTPLQYKRTFYKFINRMLFQNLVSRGASCLNVKADQIGTADFMDSFSMYLEERGKPDLLSYWQHRFVDSKNEPFIQIADFIAGSLAYCYDKSKKCEKSAEINDILYSHCSGIDAWPYGIIEIPDTLPLNEEETNTRINAFLNNKIVDFIELYESSNDVDRQMQAFVLRELYMTREYEDNTKRSIFSDDLIKRLHEAGYEELNKQSFSAKIIGKIRDAGIILCGSPLGYRIALTLNDITDYVEHDKSIIEPMLWRLNTARESIKTITTNNYDILYSERFVKLRSFVDSFVADEIKNKTMLDTEFLDEE